LKSVSKISINVAGGVQFLTASLWVKTDTAPAPAPTLMKMKHIKTFQKPHKGIQSLPVKMA
jgi:hypothetical protein